MESIPNMLTSVLTFGMVAASFVIPLLIEAALGGWKFGNLLRRVDFTMDPAELPGFNERLQRRLAELRFTATENDGEFLQRGQAVTDLGAFTHAKTPKLLRVAVEDAPPQTKIQLALHYLDGIVADTGEGAYRDAVLDYVSGQTDEMKVVPNRSYLAVCTFVGGIFVWLTLIACLVTGIEKLFEPVYVIGLTYTLLGGFAVIAIIRKPAQVTGLKWAIIGVACCVSALVAAVVLKAFV